jgi:hypothetical protein
LREKLLTSRRQTKEPKMTQNESGLHHADVPASGPNVDPAIEKTDAVISGDVEALGEEARAIDAQLHARVLRKIDWVLMPAMVIGTFYIFLVAIDQKLTSFRLWIGLLGQGQSPTV